MRRRRVLVVFGAAAACVVVLSGSGVARSASGSRLVFAASRASRWFGGIYRVTAGGRRVDLTPGPAPDLAPVVSPNGRWVAFLSGRGGEWAFYLVGIDGRGLRRISARLAPVVSSEPPGGALPQIVWASNSRSLAAELSFHSALYLGSRGGMLHVVAHHARWSFGQSFAWSPDGRFLVYSTHFGSVRVASPNGKRLWSVKGGITGSSWSQDDRLAVAVNNYVGSPHKHSVTVYDRGGHALTRFRGSAPAWSPGGTFLASVSRGAVQFRREGRGKPIWRWSAYGTDPNLQWVGPNRMRMFAEKGWVGLDVAHKRLYRLGALAKNYNSVVSPSGQILAEQANGSGGLKGSKLVLSRPGTSKPATLASAPYCGGEYFDFGGLAFVPHRRGVVYQTSCLSPPVNIYSVNPDGSGLRQLTHGQTDDYQPSLSPDGQTVVYVQQPDSVCHDGCLSTLWRIPATGGTPQQLTSYTAQYQGSGDQNPTWSPDGSRIAFQHSGYPDNPNSLQTIPASGGGPKDLNVNNALLPAWGPHLIAFSDDSAVNLTIKTFDPSTDAAQVVATGGPVLAQSLAWSNSGQLAYLYPKGRQGHWFVAIAGSTTKPIDLNAHFPPHTQVAGLAWSPDGTRFAFAATDPNGYGDIYTIATNGTDLRQITKNIGALNNPKDTISWR